MQLQKLCLGQLIITVNQLPLGITAAAPDCRFHHCPCVAGGSSSGLHFMATCDFCSVLSSLKAKCWILLWMWV